MIHSQQTSTPQREHDAGTTTHQGSATQNNRSSSVLTQVSEVEATTNRVAENVHLTLNSPTDNQHNATHGVLPLSLIHDNFPPSCLPDENMNMVNQQLKSAIVNAFDSEALAKNTPLTLISLCSGGGRPEAQLINMLVADGFHVANAVFMDLQFYDSAEAAPFQQLADWQLTGSVTCLPTFGALADWMSDHQSPVHLIMSSNFQLMSSTSTEDLHSQELWLKLNNNAYQQYLSYSQFLHYASLPAITSGVQSGFKGTPVAEVMSELDGNRSTDVTLTSLSEKSTEINKLCGEKGLELADIERKFEIYLRTQGIIG